MGPVDAWNDDSWEVIADREAAVASNTAADKTIGGHASSGSSTTSSASNMSGKPKILLKAEEENRKLWETANTTTPFEILGSGQGKTISYKPELKILKRAAAVTPTELPKVIAPTELQVLDRKEKERRYQEARERLFGPSPSGSTIGDASISGSSTPTAGMSRSSSSTGIATPGSGINQGTTLRGGACGRTSKRGSSKGNSGLNTPRNKSPNRSAGADVERVEKPIGGTLKKTGNGWIYRADEQGNGPPTTRFKNVGNEKPDQVANLSGSLMGMSLNREPYSFNTSATANVSPGTMWGVDRAGAFHGSTPWQQPAPLQSAQIPLLSSQPTPPFGCNTLSTPQPNYYHSQPRFPQYLGPNPSSVIVSQQPHQYMSSQPFYNSTPYTGPIQPQNPYVQSFSQQGSYQNSNPYLPSMKTSPHPNFTGPSISPSPAPLQSTPHTDSQTSRVVFIQDPNSFAPRPPPPKGTLNATFNFAGNVNQIDEQMPIREPKGPDSRGGKGFISRWGAGRGTFSPGGNAE